MRIIKGLHQRRVIKVPVGLPIRPTTDLAKESLFNILNNRIDFEGKLALDLFSGTGSIAFELSSRQCAGVTAVDNNIKCIQFISKTAESLKMTNLLTVKADVFKFLAGQRLGYDLIFADPPYDLPIDQYHTMVQLIYSRKLLRPEGILVVEHSRGVDFSEHAAFVELRNYGKVHFSFFEASEE